MDSGDEAPPSSRGGSPAHSRRDILTSPITSVITALGGVKDGTYILGDDAYGCLKDLKKFWRKDDTDDDRTVARIFWEARVLQNDLVPILLETAGKGNVEDRCAIACADLLTAMTWPIDIASELMELDEELDVGVDYTALLNSHLSYKAALLQPGVIQALLGIVLPCLAKTKKERKERDGQIVNVVLHLFRNLAFIRDLPSNTYLSADQAEYSSLQSKLIKTLSDAHIFDLFLALAGNSDGDPLFTTWNTLLLEIFYLLFRGVKPSYLVRDQVQAPKTDLKKLLNSEETRKRTYLRTAASRHSRFGTTISVKAGEDSMVLHRQEAITREAREIVDGTKKKKHQKVKTLDALGTQYNLTQGALMALQGLAREFISSCFNSFLSSLLKDIKSERPKITEKDNLRLLFVAKWFLEFFLCRIDGGGWGLAFNMVAELVERGWVIWVLRRMRGALDEKPKQWVELQAGIECLTQLLLLIDTMSFVTDPILRDAAEILQHQLYYNGEVLDLAFEGLQGYKEQSIAYLDSSIHLAYILLRMLEKWGEKKGDVYVRRRRARAKNRSKRKGAPEEEGVLDVVDVEDEVEDDKDMIEEQMFTFDKFEAKFAHEDITHTLLVYLSRFREYDSPENMKRVVGLLHRQAVKAKAEGLFFKVSTLDLFKTILVEQKSLPRSQPYKDLLQFIQFILRQFFKAVEKEPFLVLEAFFPKNRGQWKNFSSWEPEKKEKKLRKNLDLDEVVSSKKPRRRARRRAHASSTESEADEVGEDERVKRKQRKTKEAIIYKSAQFIDDSDALLEDDETFFAKEEAGRLRREKIAAESNRPTNMKAAGTKKRKMRKEAEGSRKKRKQKPGDNQDDHPGAPSSGDNSDSDESNETSPEAPTKPRPRPRPKPRFQKPSLGDDGSSPTPAESRPLKTVEQAAVKSRPRPRPTFRGSSSQTDESADEDERKTVDLHIRRQGAKVVVSDDEDE